MNTLTELNMLKSGYKHCPHCYKLDRFFYTDKPTTSDSIYCSGCKQVFDVLEAIKPDTSDTWHARKVEGEIVIVKNSNLHGRISAGWYGDDKILIGSATCPDIEQELMMVAERQAEKRNNKQNKPIQPRNKNMKKQPRNKNIKPDKKKLYSRTWEGKMWILEQEGGFCSPGIEIGEIAYESDNITSQIEDDLELFENKNDSSVGPLGKFRITIEQLS